eukprot:7287429-Prorocentrum_lima.AAC.1
MSANSSPQGGKGAHLAPSKGASGKGKGRACSGPPPPPGTGRGGCSSGTPPLGTRAGLDCDFANSA